MDSISKHDGSRLVLVTGGTGGLGRHVVAHLAAGGPTTSVRVLSRGNRDPVDGAEHVTADLDTGAGVAAAVAGVDAVLHLAGSQQGDAAKTQTLVDAVVAGGARPHLVFISVVGAERIPVKSRTDRAMFGYFESKRGAELVVERSGLPWTTLRATQFHDLILSTVSAMAKLPVVPVPAGVRFQPVETAEVAARLVELVAGAPEGLVDDLAGPRTFTLRELLRGYLAAAGKHRLIVPIPVPGGAGRAIKAGANLAPDHADGRRTWEQFLAERVGPVADAAGAVAQMTP